MRKIALTWAFFLLASPSFAAVVDEAGLLSSQQVQSLNTLTANGHVAIHIAGSTKGLPLKVFADEWAKEQKASNPATEVAITVIPSSRQLFITAASDAKGRFTTADSDAVIHQILIPAFRASDWSGGLEKAVHAIEGRLSSEAGYHSSTSTSTVPPAKREERGIDVGLIILFAAVLLLVIGLVWWSSWGTKFRHFEAVVSAGIPDFTLAPEVKAQQEVADALEMLQDLHRALPLGFWKRASYYGRRKDDFRSAYETCFRAQQAWEEERQREEEARRRYEDLKGRMGSLPEEERARFLAMEAQYQASGYNNALLLQNMLMMDMMMTAMTPRVIYEPVIIEERDSGWQSGSDDFDGGSGSDDGGTW